MMVPCGNSFLIAQVRVRTGAETTEVTKERRRYENCLGDWRKNWMWGSWQSQNGTAGGLHSFRLRQWRCKVVVMGYKLKRGIKICCALFILSHSFLVMLVYNFGRGEILRMLRKDKSKRNVWHEASLPLSWGKYPENWDVIFLGSYSFFKIILTWIETNPFVDLYQIY